MVACMGVANRLKHLCTSTFSKKTSKGPESAVFVPESAVFPTYNLEVSRFFRNFAMQKKYSKYRKNSLHSHTFVTP
jgi:hypothetical protein